MALLYELEIQYFRYANYERASFFQNRTEDLQVEKKKFSSYLRMDCLFVCPLKSILSAGSIKIRKWGNIHLVS